MGAEVAAGVLPVAAVPVGPEEEIDSRAARAEADQDRVGPGVVVSAVDAQVDAQVDARVDAQIHARAAHAAIGSVKMSGSADQSHPSLTSSIRTIRS